MRIALYCSVWRNYGGWSTYVKHISQGFADCLGVEVAVVVGSGKERPRLEWRDRLAFAGLGYLDVADIILIAVPPLTMEGCIGLARRDRAPTVMVLHDPTEWHKKDSRQVLDLVRPQLFYFVGERDRHTFIREMGYRAEMVVHKHPYHRIGGGSDVTRTNRVVATSRIDWDKNTHLIVAAKRGVELWAGYIDWRYNYEKFGGAISKHPDYRGKFGVDDESIHRVYEGACALVDLSAISGGGGRTQYTFLEAMDFGLALILNQGWGTGEMVPGVNYVPVGSVESLQEAIDRVRASGNPHREAQEKVLREHDATLVCQGLLERFRKLTPT